MKRAQVQTQIFIYIMALVIGAGILIYGYNAVIGFKKQADEVIYLEFETTLKNDLKSLSFGSVKIKNYNLPTTTAQVCFKTKDAIGDAGYSAVSTEQVRQQSKYTYTLIANAIKAGTEDNIFVYPKGERAFFAGVNLDLGSTIKFKCFDVKSGVLKIKITGQGSSVLVSE